MLKRGGLSKGFTTQILSCSIVQFRRLKRRPCHLRSNTLRPSVQRRGSQTYVVLSRSPKKGSVSNPFTLLRKGSKDRTTQTCCLNSSLLQLLNLWARLWAVVVSYLLKPKTAWVEATVASGTLPHGNLKNTCIRQVGMVSVHQNWVRRTQPLPASRLSSTFYLLEETRNSYCREAVQDSWMRKPHKQTSHKCVVWLTVSAGQPGKSCRKVQERRACSRVCLRYVT